MGRIYRAGNRLAESEQARGGLLIARVQFLQATCFIWDAELQFSESSGILNRNCGIEAMRGRFISRSPNESFRDIAGGG